jgi:hypothetical protein
MTTSSLVGIGSTRSQVLAVIYLLDPEPDYLLLFSMIWALMSLRDTPAYLSSMVAFSTPFLWCLVELVITSGGQR